MSMPLSYNIALIKEYKMGDVTIPLFFSIDKIKSFIQEAPVSPNESYTLKLGVEESKALLFKYVLLKDFKLDTEFLTEFPNYRDNIDYTLINKNEFIINSKEFLYDIILKLCDMEGVDSIRVILDIKHIASISEDDIIKAFDKRVSEDLDIEDKTDSTGNNITHMFGWMLGETATNPNPVFPENLNKASIDWSYREVRLRNLYRSKCFAIEYAKAEKERKYLEDRKKNKNKR